MNADFVAVQLSLPLFPDEENVEITVTKIWNEGDHYSAELFGGWFIGHGKTIQAAIDTAVNEYVTQISFYRR
jgi:hypothetical protein